VAATAGADVAGAAGTAGAEVAATAGADVAGAAGAAGVPAGAQAAKMVPVAARLAAFKKSRRFIFILLTLLFHMKKSVQALNKEGTTPYIFP
jgi:hypothetical protein